MKATSRNRRQPDRGGFTLIEMLVSVTLIVLMMLMFAEVFQVATGSISTQRGLAENDQAARTLTTIIRADLAKRSFRNLVPFFPNERPLATPTSFAKRRGFFYISENDPDDDTDDVLHFTMDVRIITQNKDETLYFGRGMPMTPASTFSIVANQPDSDDGDVAVNFTAASTTAEVVYFLRDGTLYRRVLLVREHLPVANGDKQPSTPGTPAMPGTPLTLPDSNLFDGVYPPGDFTVVLFGPDGAPGDIGVDDDSNGIVDDITELGWSGTDDVLLANNNFYRYFDYSARSSIDRSDPMNITSSGALFAGIDSMNNNGQDPFLMLSGNAGATALGNPAVRFGYNHEDGLPREFVGGLFIGRFTQEENSHEDFNYPQSFSEDSTGAMIGNGNPMDATDPALTLGNDGVVDQFRGGPRRGEDILLANVHSFNVEVWDDRLGQFVDLGHQLAANANGELGDYHFDRIVRDPGNLSEAYGPVGAGSLNNIVVFDTWHPQPTPLVGIDLDSNNVTDPPPFRPMNFYPDTSDPALPAASPLNPNTSLPNLPANFSHFGPTQAAWLPDTDYTTEDLNGNGVLDPGEDANSNGILDADVVFPRPKLGPRPAGNALYYQCVRTGRSSVDEDVDGDGKLDMNEDLDGDGNLDVAEDLNGNGILDMGEDVDGDGNLDVNEDVDGDGVLDVDEDTNMNGILDGEPVWPVKLDSIITEYTEVDLNGDGVVDPIEDFNGNGVFDDGPTWKAVYNLRPMRAIRITIRFQHNTTQQMRQLTLMYSLAD